MANLKTAHVKFEDSSYNYSTSVNGNQSDAEIVDYFKFKYFNLGHLEDDMQMCIDCEVEPDDIIRKDDEFTFTHPDYPNSSLKGKTLIAGEVTDTHVQRFEQGSLNDRRYPIEYCTKIKSN